MKISVIVAMAANRAIGLDNQMPWHLSADLKKFKQITMGSPILMGRKTFESIGRPLPGRQNMIISRNTDYQQQGCDVFNSIDEAFAACQKEDEIFVIGGATFYQAVLERADLLYLTEIHKTFHADTYFPEFDPADWREIAREDIDNDPAVDFSYSFLTLQRIKFQR